MPREPKRTITEIAGDILVERRRAVGDAAAERRGPPAGAERIPERVEREAYWKRFLPPEQEQLLRTFYFDEKSHSVMAEELGLPLGTVKSRLRLALAKLRHMLIGLDS